jgi:kynurenine formamidase
MTQLIDLSVPISSRGHLRRMPEIQYWDHKTYAELRAPQIGLQSGHLRGWGFLAMENVSMTPHEGTHLDAPWHFSPTSEGRPAKTIDQIPLEWCFNDGVVLDFHQFERERPILIGDLEEALHKISYKLKPFDIVLIRTDATKHWLEEGYEDMGAGLTAESTLWLIDQGIKIMGKDTWTWDQPFDVMKKRNQPERFLEAHFIGHKREYCHLESLANLDKIPKPFDFKVSVFPIKIEKASAGWVRAVAIIDN